MTPILRAALISPCALLGRFHPPDPFAKPPPRFSVSTPIAPDRLFFNVRSVGRMTRPPCSAPVPSLAGFIRLILLRSLLLDSGPFVFEYSLCIFAVG